MPGPLRTYCSFLVRLWLETSAHGQQWAGEVERVQDGRVWQFESLEELARFFSSVERFLEAGPDASDISG